MKIYKIYVEGYLVQPIVTIDKERMYAIRADATTARRAVIVTELRKEA